MIFKINFLWIFTNFLLKIIAKITKQGFILISLFPIDTQNLSPDDPFAPPSKKSRTDPPSISCSEASLFSPVQVEPQKKRVIFPSEIDLLETSRFFFRNQSPVSFTTLDEIDTFSKMFPSDMDCEKFFDMDWGRFQSCTFQKELLEKKKKGRLFKILEECFDCKEAFEKKFSKLFLPLYFRLELKNRLRDLSGLNELDHDLAEIIDLGFIPFFISKKTSRDSPFSINEIKIWIEKMLNASIYKEAQSHLQLLLGELEDIYDLCENRVKNILEPPIDHTSPAFITSLKFWVRFLGSYPGCLFQVFELFTEEHPIKEDIEAELKELTEATIDRAETLTKEGVKKGMEEIKLAETEKRRAWGKIGKEKSLIRRNQSRDLVLAQHDQSESYQKKSIASAAADLWQWLSQEAKRQDLDVFSVATIEGWISTHRKSKATS